jgi:hypothetical protein
VSGGVRVDPAVRIVLRWAAHACAGRSARLHVTRPREVVRRALVRGHRSGHRPHDLLCVGRLAPLKQPS